MEQFRRLLIEVFNNSDLPFDARYYVIKDVYRDVLELYENFLKEQEAELAKRAEETMQQEKEYEEYQRKLKEEIEKKNIPQVMETEEVK